MPSQSGGLEIFMKLFMIARSNIRKNKSMSFTLVVLIIFAAILLYIGTSVMMEMNSFLDNKNKELTGSSFTVFAPTKYEDTVKNLVEQAGGYEQIENIKAISSTSSVRNVTRKEKKQSMGCLILNADKKEQISKLKLIDQGDKKLTNSIILPYYLKVAKGYHTGDEISINYEGIDHSFIIYGFSEDIMFAIPSNLSVYKYYVFDEEFTKLYEESESSQFFMIKTLLSKNTDTTQYGDSFVKAINREIKDSTSLICSLDYDSMKVGVSIFFIIIMVILIVFSVIIILIALTVIRFAVTTYIEGNIQNIGSMEALGYTGRELVLGTVLQFALITFASTIIGLLISVGCAGIITNMVSSSIGLAWNSKINLLCFIINIAIIMSAVMVITYMTASKIKRITPIIALRNGIENHNFKKNYFPLSQGVVNVNMAVGFKTLMRNMKQNITILIIITLMSFVCVFAFTANYNFVVDNTAMLRLVGLEKSHLLVNYIGEDTTKVFDEISQMEKVKKTIRLTRMMMTVYMGEKESTPSISICNDFNQLEIKTIVEGRYPIHDNEIALTALVMKQLNVKLGNTITLKGEGTKEDYIIVGITQHINNLGKGGCITEEGIKRINPDFIPSDLYIYLDSSKEIASVTKAIEGKYGSLELKVINMEDEFKTILESFNKAITALCVGCIIITLFIISLVLYLLIKIKLIKERTRIGISKALGYTTKQLILQIICSFSPVCMLGALFGTMIAMYLINPLLAGLLSVGGSIQNCHFKISPMLTLITFLSISLYSIIVTTIVARQVRKITPCELFR